MPITLSTAPVAEVRALAAETLAANDPIVVSKFRLQFGCEAQQFINMTTKQQQLVLDDFEPVALTLRDFGERRKLVDDLSCITRDPDDAGTVALIYPGDCFIECVDGAEKGSQLRLILSGSEWLRPDGEEGRQELEKILFEQYYLAEIVYLKDIHAALKIVHAQTPEYQGVDFQDMVFAFARDSDLAYHSIAKHYAARC